MKEIYEHNGRFYCGACNNQIRKPTRVCKSCGVELLRFESAKTVAGVSAHFERLKCMVSQRFMSDRDAMTDDSVAAVLYDGLKCSKCGESLKRPTPTCPSCSRYLYGQPDAMKAVRDIPPNKRPSDETILRFMAGSGTMEPTDTPTEITHKKLLTGIPDDMWQTLNARRVADGVPVNELIRRAIRNEYNC